MTLTIEVEISYTLFSVIVNGKNWKCHYPFNNVAQKIFEQYVGTTIEEILVQPCFLSFWEQYTKKFLLE